MPKPILLALGLILSPLLTGAQSSSDFNNGLVGYFPLDGDANDISGNQYHGILNGAIPTDDRDGNPNSAMYFDGSSSIDIIDSLSAFQFEGAFTISLWGAWPTAGNLNYSRLVSMDANIYPSYGSYQVIMGAGSFIQQCGGTIRTDLEYVWSGPTGEFVAENEWRHIAVVYDGDSICAYENGGNKICHEVSGTAIYDGNPLRIGRGLSGTGAPQFYTGSIDEVIFWNVALSDAQIAALSLGADTFDFGCIDSTACNFSPTANLDDGSCIPAGCTDFGACNYLESAGCDDGNCDYSCCPGPGCCLDGTVWDYDSQGCVVANPTDVDLDGCVGVTDVLEILANFGACFNLEPEGTWMCGDTLEYWGYWYQTVEIGNQCWFAENLRTSTYLNGDSIPYLLNDAEWTSTTSGATSIWGEGSTICYSSNPDFDACQADLSLSAFGRLYNWYSIDDSRGICPNNWHVSNDSNWHALQNFSSENGFAGNEGTAFKKTTGWCCGGNGLDSFGFSGMPGGERASTVFDNAGSMGNWWTYPAASNQLVYWRLSGNDDVMTRRSYAPGLIEYAGFSVRCVKD